MALNFGSDNTILYLMDKVTPRVINRIINAAAAGEADIATAKSVEQLRQDARDLSDLIRQAAEQWSEELSETEESLIGRIEAIDGTFFYIRYSPNQEGVPMTVRPNDDTAYIGVCSTNQSTAPTDPTAYTWSRILGRDALTLQIISTHGNIFKNGDISTTLSVKIWYGDDDITENFDDNEFRWTRVSADTTGDASWNSAHIGGTKTIVITNSDVNIKATFHCELLDET